MYRDRRVYLLVLYVLALHLQLSIGGNPRDSAQVSARNVANNGTSSSGSTRTNSSTNIACREDVLDQCPPNASCDKGQCVCLFGYKLNGAYHGKNASTAASTSVPSTTNVASITMYCLPDEAGGVKATSLQHGGATSSHSNKTPGDAAAAAEGDGDGKVGQGPQREPTTVGAHHILGGVLIPLAFVVILIGSAILAKRTDLWSRLRQRFHAHRNRHRRRPAYEDVVLVGFEPQAGRL